MPAVAIAVASAVGGAFAATLFTNVIVGALVGALVSAAISFAGAAIFGLNKAPKAPDVTFAARDRTQMVRQPITARRTIYGQVKVSGPITFLHTSANKRDLWILLTISGHPLEEIGDIYLNDELVPLSGTAATGNYAGFVSVWKGLGTDATDADLLAELRSAASGVWTTEHKQTGCGKLLIKLTFDQDKFASGIPQVRAIVKGKKVLDPRTGTTAWSANAALCIHDYLTSVEGLGATATEIDLDMVEAAADTSDEAVSILPTGTQARYTINGTVDADQAPKEVIPTLLTACAGRVTYSGGKWRLMVGAWRAPTVTLTEDDLDGPLPVTARRSRRDLFNGVRAIFVNPSKNWQPDDAPPVSDAVYVDEDNGEPIWADREYPFSIYSATVQRLAKIDLERNRRQLSVSYPCKLTALRLMAGDTVRVTNERRGWVGKAFEVIDWQFAIRNEGDVPRLGVDLALQEVGDNGSDYDWDVSEEQAQTAYTAISLAGPSDVEEPTGLIVSSQPYTSPTGDQIPGLQASWTAADDGFVVDYEAQFKASAASDWSQSISTRGQLSAYIFPLTNGTSYDVRVRSINTRSARSDWVTVTGTVAAGDLTPPAVATSVAAADGSGEAVVTWTNPNDADFNRARVFRSTANDSATSTQVHEAYALPGSAGSWTNTGLAAGTYYYWIKTVDTTGNASDFSAGDSATVT